MTSLNEVRLVDRVRRKYDVLFAHQRLLMMLPLQNEKQKRNNSTQLLSNNTPKRGTASLSSAHLRVDSNGSLECSLKSLHIQTANLIELGPE